VLLQFVKYNLVGIVNTVTGFSIILVCMYFGLTATTSNLIGYAIGSIISYLLNSKYTFQTKTTTKTVIVKFFAVLIIAYLLNYFSLQWLLHFLNPYLSQLISAVIYTISSFLMMRFFVFSVHTPTVATEEI